MLQGLFIKDVWKALLLLALMSLPLNAQTPERPKRPPSACSCGFVPGDSFFAIWIHQEHSPLYEIDPFALQFPEDRPKELIFEYSTPVRPQVYGGAHGWKGVHYCHVLGYTKQHSRLLRMMCAWSSRESKIMQEEAYEETSDNHNFGSFLMLIVNKDFDLERGHFFNRYNENWKSMGGYHPHLWMPEAVIDDWRNAERFPELNAKLVGFDKERHLIWAYHQMNEKLYLEVNMDDILIVCIPTTDHSVAFRKDLHSTFYSMDSDHVYQHQWTYDHNESEIKLVRKKLSISD